MRTGDLHRVAPALAGTRFADVRLVAETGSTNADLLAAAAAGAPEGLVLVADHQTAGRGRLGRRWEAAPGSSLLVSVLLRPELPPARLHLATLAVAMAAVDACAAVAGARPGLKWPNDLVAQDRKLAGVLAESSAAGGRVDAVVVGIGLNVAAGAVPPALATTAVSAEELAGRPVDRDALLVALLVALDRRWAAVAAGPHGGDELVAAARAASATIGRRVLVELAADRTVTGTAVDLTAGGHLLVRDDAGHTHEVVAGDVVHLRPTPPGQGGCGGRPAG